jgi:Ca2+-transporting ATPase
MAPTQTPARGLSTQEAARRLVQSGRNRIRHEERRSWLGILASQFAGAMVWLLLGACVLSAALGERADAIAIAAIVLLNAAVGFAQEYRAERALGALRRLTAPRARVLRDGHPVVIAASEVVPGDWLVLEAGDLVAADARLREAHALQASEAPLTGESAPVAKRAQPAPADAPLAERFDHVFMGTAIAAGTGVAEVTATGMTTELGKIAHLLAEARSGPTPLEQRIRRITNTLLVACLGIVGLVAGIGLWRGIPWLDILLTSVSLAVAAVPEGLAAVVTIALALGVQRMAARHALVRQMRAIETLGSVTVICTDKTGTLTTGTMTVREVWGERRAVLAAAAACCDAELPAGQAGPAAEAGASQAVAGDPTELALLAAAAELGVQRADIESENPRVHVEPFDSERRRMAVLRRDGTLFVKGAPETVIARCAAGTGGALAANEAMAARGLRVLAVATGRGQGEQGLTLLGLVGIADPPRPEVVDAIARAQRAGIDTVMITGDQAATAAAIARELGLERDGRTATVHARATAADKLAIVRRLKQEGAVVAMTGDGVNDAPALKEAHVGVAMGITGTEVTREASDVVLTDDNYATIVAAVQEGRGIYDNIRKTLVYLLTGNVAELLVVLGAVALGWPIPLLPLHLLWINLVTDGLPALALVTDPVDGRVLERPPRPLHEATLGRGQWRRIVLIGVVEAAVVLAMFSWASERSLEHARTMAFFTLVACEVLRVFAARDEQRTLWQVGAFTNLRLLGVVALSLAGQLALLELAPLARLFELTILPWRDLALGLTVALIPVTLLELAKLGMQRLRPRRQRPAPPPRESR